MKHPAINNINTAFVKARCVWKLSH